MKTSEKNNKTIISPADFYRKEHFAFFKDFVNPFISITCNVDAKLCRERSRREGVKFFQLYLYAILHAVNDIEEFHYRLSAEGEIVRYERINVVCPIKLTPESPYVTMVFEYKESFAEFKACMDSKIENHDKDSVFGEEDKMDEFDVVLVSAIPDLPFTSFPCAQKNKNGNDFPIITVGMLNSNGEMPIAISVHHAFVDGEHVARFYQLVEHYMTNAE